MQHTSRCLLCANSGILGNHLPETERPPRSGLSCFDQMAVRAASSFAFRGSRAKPSVSITARLSYFTGAGKPYREPHCIVRKRHAWRFSGIREYCFDPLRWPGSAAMRLSHNCTQHGWPTQRIFRKAFLGSFGGTRACCSRPLAHRRTVL